MKSWSRYWIFNSILSILKFDVLIKFHSDKWPRCVWCIISFTPSPVPRFTKVWVRLDWNPFWQGSAFFPPSPFRGEVVTWTWSALKSASKHVWKVPLSSEFHFLSPSVQKEAAAVITTRFYHMCPFTSYSGHQCCVDAAHASRHHSGIGWDQACQN